MRQCDEWQATIELRMPGARHAAAVTVLAAGVRLRVVTAVSRPRS